VIDDLTKQGKVVGSRANFARAGVRVAVKAGAPKPDIGTPEAFQGGAKPPSVRRIFSRNSFAFFARDYAGTATNRLQKGIACYYCNTLKIFKKRHIAGRI
jgi:hypothetical protein